jgi:hypothetical protein
VLLWLVLLATAFGLGSGITALALREQPVRTTPGPFVQRDGIALTRGGQPFRFTGLNVYNAASTGNCWYPMGAAGLNAALTDIAEGSSGRAKVVRVWFFQPLATKDGERNWTALDETLRTARARGFLVIPVLGNHWDHCDGHRGPRTEQWYASGYRSAEAGNPVSYRDWVAEVVGRYRDDPTVACGCHATWLRRRRQRPDQVDRPESPPQPGHHGDRSVRGLLRGVRATSRAA